MCIKGRHTSNILLIIHLLLLIISAMLSYTLGWLKYKYWSPNDYKKNYCNTARLVIAVLLLSTSSNVAIFVPLYAQINEIQFCLQDGWKGVLRVVAISLSIVTGLQIIVLIVSIGLTRYAYQIMITKNRDLFFYLSRRGDPTNIFGLRLRQNTTLENKFSKIDNLQKNGEERLSNVVLLVGQLVGSNLTAVLTFYVTLNQLAIVDNSVADNLVTGAVALLIASTWLSFNIPLLVIHALLYMLYAEIEAKSIHMSQLT